MDRLAMFCADVGGFVQQLANDAREATNVSDLVTAVQNDASDAASRLSADAQQMQSYGEYADAQDLVRSIERVRDAGLLEFTQSLKSLETDLSTFKSAHCS